MDVNNFSLQESYMQIPPVTRAWLTGVVAVTVGSRFGLVPLSNLALDLGLVFQRLQLWRLVTSFFFLGPLDLSWLINLFMMCAGWKGAPSLASRPGLRSPCPLTPLHAPLCPRPRTTPAQLQAERGL